MTNEQLIDLTVDVIINTRDFCGNEKEAAMDFLADHNLRGSAAISIFKAANFRANKAWNGFQRAAGVPEKHLF
jgi:hypothetical protein